MPDFGAFPTMVLLNLSILEYTNRWNTTNMSAIYIQKNARKYYPAFSIHQSGEDIYVAIRGSAESNDFDTLLDDAEVITEIGTFHHGYYLAALNTYKKCLNVLANCKGKVYFTGHSYGGSVATIMYFIAKNDHIYNLDIYCCAFAPVPCVGYEMAKQETEKIITIVNSNDVFPRLSRNNVYRTVNKLSEGFLLSKRQALEDLRGLIEKYNITGVQLGNTLKEQLLDYAPKMVDYTFDIQSGLEYNLTYSAGTTVVIGRDSCKTMTECIVDQSEELNELPVAEDSIKMHLLMYYRSSLQSIDTEK